MSQKPNNGFDIVDEEIALLESQMNGGLNESIADLIKDIDTPQHTMPIQS